MGGITNQLLSGTALLVAGLIFAQSATAAPPIRIQPQSRPPVTVQARAPQASPAQTQAQTQQRLDLRAPSHMPEMSDDVSERSFPSRRPNTAAQEAVQLPALGAEGVRARPTIQEFVRRVHQEGLPVARIFEGKSALVHLGLNPKGKPGLWLVQKTR
jgi:hypothetical protein